MASWRVREFVPDSDDEGGEISQNSHESQRIKDSFVHVDDILPPHEIGAETIVRPTKHDVKEAQDAPSRHSWKGEAKTSEGVDSPCRRDTLMDLDEEEDELALPALRVVVVKPQPTIPPNRLFTSDDQEPDELSNNLVANQPTVGEQSVKPQDVQNKERGPLECPSASEEELLSSELSSVSSSPRSLSPQAPTYSDNDTISTALRKEPVVLINALDIEGKIGPRPSRNLRQRTAIQLNPYAIEGQRYKDSFKSRGLKPLNIQQEVDRETQEDPTVEPFTSDRDNAARPSSGLRSSIASQQEAYASLDFASSPPAEQEDLPDLATLLRQSAKGILNRGFKRQKLKYTSTERSLIREHEQEDGQLSPILDKRRFKVPPGLSNSGVGGPFPRSLQKAKPPRESFKPPAASNESSKSPEVLRLAEDPILPSPTLTNSSQLGVLKHQTAASVTAIQPVGTPLQLQTPATSSERKPSTRSPARIHILSDNESEQKAPVGEIQEVPTDKSEESSEGEAYRQLLRAQRRTRGVLPASWHRLEYQNQREKVARVQKQCKASLQSPVKEARVCVARRLSSSNTKKRVVGDHKALLHLIDDESDSHPEIAAGSKRITHSIEPLPDLDEIPALSIISDDDDEDMEDDTIDAMLASASRSSKGTKRKRTSKQLRITDTLRVSGKRASTLTHGKPSPTETPRPKQRRDQRGSGQKLRKPRKRIQKISISDMLGDVDRAATPSFLNIASRTARQRIDMGRHSPTGKVFRLQSKDDMGTVQESLERWKQGKLKPARFLKASQSRRPLTERAINNLPASRYRQESDEKSHSCTLSPTQSDRIQKSNLLQGNVQQAHYSGFSTNKSVHPRKSNTQRKHNMPHAGRVITSLVRPARSQAPAQLESGPSYRKSRSLVRNLNDFALKSYLHAIDPKFDTDSSNAAGHEENRSTKRLVQYRKRLPKQTTWVAEQLPEGDLYLDIKETAIDLTNSKGGRAGLAVRESTSALTGLRPFGTEHTTTFGVEHLPDGPLFDNTTLLGSGDFARSLMPPESQLSSVVLHVCVGASVFEWQDWNETTSDQIRGVIDDIIQYLRQGLQDHGQATVDESQPLYLLNSIIRYLGTHMRFLDPIDRKIFASRFSTWISIITDELHGVMISESLARKPPIVGISTRVLVLTNLVQMIASHVLVPSEVKSTFAPLFSRSLRQTVRILFQDGFRGLLLFSHDTVNMSTHVSRQSAKASVEAFVIILHLLQQPAHSRNIWEVLQQEQILWLQAQEQNVQALDNSWCRMFTLLPYFEVDVRGVVQAQAYRRQKLANWQLVKQLLQPVLEVGQLDSIRRASTFNAYCRAIFGRCFHLIQYWNWLDCESIIAYLFDFFARNNLGDLPLEENCGSPAFLECLTDQLKLKADKNDRCFHILLKIIGTGMRALRSITTSRRVSNCVFRLTPNHDRQLPKEQQIRQEDLDAVRNHFDLLCMLYWAAPSGYRLRLHAIQNLLDIEDSHRQACHLVIRSWSYLVNYQLSTNEPLTSLEPFVQWYNEILEKTVKLHRLARSEVDKDASAAEVSLGYMISQETRESTIAHSQRHIEAIIMDALSSLKRALIQTKTHAASAKLLTPKLVEVLSLFDPKYPRTSSIVASTLDVIRTFVSHSGSIKENDDSQGFGDWSAFEELDPEIGTSSPVLVDESIYKALHDLLSDAFGSDIPADDVILQDVIHTWLLVAEVKVKAGDKTWDNYIDPYQQDSWEVLRLTDQRRRFAPFFFSKLLEMNSMVYENNKTIVLREWVASLVERESLIKYQPLLTTALLNQDTTEPLLDNPPFWRNRASGEFEVSVKDFCERRIALISCFLSNMRESISFMTYHNLPQKPTMMRQYADMLKHLMTTMRSNYQNLGQGSDMQGAYVDFVQKVVELLQQHTTDICKVDQFFTDASNFPLPDNDPEYIVGHLKSLGLRLNLPGTTQKLSSFVLTICERAATQDQQIYFSSLLQTAMEDTLCLRNLSEPTLCCFIIRILFPTHSKFTLTTPCGWITATPLFLALPPVLEALLFHINAFNTANILAAETLLSSIMHSIHNSCTALLSLPSLIQQPHTFRVLAHYLAILTSTLEPLAHITSTRHSAKSYAASIILENVRDFVLVLLPSDMPHSHTDPDLPFPPTLPTALKPAQSFASDQLRDALDPGSGRCKWKADGQGRHYFLKSRRWEEVKVRLGMLEEEKREFEKRGSEFVRVVERMGGTLGMRPAGIGVEAGQLPGRN